MRICNVKCCFVHSQSMQDIKTWKGSLSCLWWKKIWKASSLKARAMSGRVPKIYNCTTDRIRICCVFDMAIIFLLLRVFFWISVKVAWYCYQSYLIDRFFISSVISGSSFPHCHKICLDIFQNARTNLFTFMVEIISLPPEPVLVKCFHTSAWREYCSKQLFHLFFKDNLGCQILDIWGLAINFPSETFSKSWV